MRQPYGSTRQGKPHDVAMLGMLGPIRPHSSAQDVCLAGLAQQSWDIAVEKTAKRPWEARGTALGVIGCGDRVLRIAVNALIIMRLGAFWDYPRSWVSSFHQLWFWTTQCFIYLFRGYTFYFYCSIQALGCPVEWTAWAWALLEQSELGTMWGPHSRSQLAFTGSRN